MPSLGSAVDGAVESVAPKALNGGKMAVSGGKKAGKAFGFWSLQILIYVVALGALPFSLGWSVAIASILNWVIFGVGIKRLLGQ